MVDYDTDICVSVDIDEVLEKGWRKKLEKNWKENTTRASYTYNWSHDEKGKPQISFYADKIHSRFHYKWVNPVHEVLYCDTDEVKITIPDLVIDHYPDSEKSRSSYLPLLELAVEENPNNDRNMHYLGREYMYYGYYDKAIDTLIRHLEMKESTWKDERCASMRFIGRCYKKINRYLESEMWYKKAIDEAPYLRDPYIEMALLKHELKEYEEVYINCKKALEIKANNKTYINESFSFDETVYDLLSIASYNMGNIEEALGFTIKALKINPNNERIKNNKKIIEEKL